MSLSQPTSPSAVGTTPTPRLRIQSVDTTGPALPNPRNSTYMCWARHTGGFTNQYNDLIAESDHGDVIGMTFQNPTGTQFLFAIGDNLNDWISNYTLVDDVWYHLCFTTIQTGAQAAYGRGYVNGIEEINTDGLTGSGGSSNNLHNFVTPVETNVVNDDVGGPAFMALFNSRASSNPGDSGAVFQGHMAGVKIWTNVALSPAEIRREMWSYTAVRRDGLWAESPLLDLNEAKHTNGGLIGIDWTVMGTNFVQGVIDPPGVTLYESFNLNNMVMLLGAPPTPPSYISAYTRPFPYKPGSATLRGF